MNDSTNKYGNATLYMYLSLMGLKSIAKSSMWSKQIFGITLEYPTHPNCNPNSNPIPNPNPNPNPNRNPNHN